MKLNLTYRLLIVLAILTSLNHNSFSQQNDEDPLYYIFFEQIDNQVEVFVNGKKIYKSEFIEGGGSLFIEVPLDEHLKEGNNKVKVILINGYCEDCFQNPWGIMYEVFEYDDLTYSVSKFSKGEGGNSSGEVWSETHDIFYE